MRATLTAQSFWRTGTESLFIVCRDRPGRRHDPTRLADGVPVRYQSLGRYQGHHPVDALVVANGNGEAMLNEETPMPQPLPVASVCRQHVPLPRVSISGIHGHYR